MTAITFPLIVFGVCIGSFLNVIIYRLPRKKSFLFNRSKCPACKKNLNVIDLFPIISWIFLSAKCRYCRSSISFRYPFVEFLTAFLFYLCLESAGFNYNFPSGIFEIISGCILASFLIVLFFIDIDEMILPNSVTYSGAVVGLILVCYYNLFVVKSSNDFFLDNLFAYFIAFFGFSLFSVIVKIIIKKPGLGGGDTKLFAMSGAWLGTTGLEVTTVLTFLLSAIYVVFGLIFRFLKRGEYIPLGPFICSSIFLVWSLGPIFWFKLLGNIFWWKYL